MTSGTRLIVTMPRVSRSLLIGDIGRFLSDIVPESYSVRSLLASEFSRLVR